MSNVVSHTPTLHEPPTPTAKSRVFGMVLSPELDGTLADLAASQGLTKSAVARMALERGLPILTQQLNPETAAK